MLREPAHQFGQVKMGVGFILKLHINRMSFYSSAFVPFERCYSSFLFCLLHSVSGSELDECGIWVYDMYAANMYRAQCCISMEIFCALSLSLSLSHVKIYFKVTPKCLTQHATGGNCMDHLSLSMHPGLTIHEGNCKNIMNLPQNVSPSMHQT